MDKKVNALIIAMVLMLPVALGGCGGGSISPTPVMISPTPAQVTETVVTEKAWDYVLTPNGTVVNNAWSLDSTQSSRKYQALIKRWGGSIVEPQYGWKWDLENIGGKLVLTAPHIMFGWKPWDTWWITSNGFGFPKRVCDVQQLKVHYDVEYEGQSDHNFFGSAWLTTKPNTDPTFQKTDITTEFMVWTHRGSFSPAGTHYGEVTIDGTVWDVYMMRDMHDAGGQETNTWTYIAYVSKEDTYRISYDFAKLLQDAASRGFIQTTDYICNYEVGMEIHEGTGKVLFRELSVDLR